MSRLFVVLNGPPGSGKTTIARPLAAALGLPLLAKDDIKEALADVLMPATVDESRRLGTAAVLILLRVARDSQGAVLEGPFNRRLAVDEIGALDGRVVEVFCRCARDVALGRYRARQGTRHPCHHDELRTDDELWHDDYSQPIAAGWPVIDLDTTRPVDVADLARKISLH